MRQGFDGKRASIRPPAGERQAEAASFAAGLERRRGTETRYAIDEVARQDRTDGRAQQGVHGVAEQRVATLVDQQHHARAVADHQRIRCALDKGTLSRLHLDHLLPQRRLERKLPAAFAGAWRLAGKASLAGERLSRLAHAILDREAAKLHLQLCAAGRIALGGSHLRSQAIRSSGGVGKTSPTPPRCRLAAPTQGATAFVPVEMAWSSIGPGRPMR